MESEPLEALSAYIPIDRLQALLQNRELPNRTWGAALFADISGFTPLTEALVRQLGPQLGAEELTRHLNAVYTALINELESYGGSVIGFSGDAITCWFDTQREEGPLGASLQMTALRASACSLAMQAAISQYASISTSPGNVVSLAMKAAVAAGPVRRFLVGDPSIQRIDTLAGATLDSLAEAEHLAKRGEVVLSPETLSILGKLVRIAEWREHSATGHHCATLAGLETNVPRLGWPSLSMENVEIEILRPWLLPPVFERLQRGMGEFLADFRPVVTLFLRFHGIDYDQDEAAGEKLDAYIRWVQRIINRYEGHLLQLTIGDKGSYLCGAFGAPIVHEDDAVRAVSAALELRNPPPELAFAGQPQIGLAQGEMRAGAYGSSNQRTYGVMSDEINLSARLMQAASPGQILASRTTSQATAGQYIWESLPDMQLKGKAAPVAVCSLVGPALQRKTRLQSIEYSLPMVGRRKELDYIQQKLAQAADRQGQLIGITGEAGMGKSRLIAEAVNLGYEVGFELLAGECESYGTQTSYLVWQSIWRDFFDLDASASVEAQVQRLDNELSRLGLDLTPRLPLLGVVLNLPIPDNDLTRSFDAKLRKTSTESLLVDCLRRRAREKPMLFVLEDCHWLDPLSNDLLEAIGRSIAGLPVLLLMAYRPALPGHPQAVRVSQLPHFSEIRLANFDRQEAERLIRMKLEVFFGAQAGVFPELVDRIMTRSEGNPFYIEELLNYLKDRGLHPENAQAFERLTLPTSLQSLILSRLDQLTESQLITLKVASVIGRLFKAAMLWGVYPALGDQQRVVADLENLGRIDLTQLESPEPELIYLFKHVITQEVTYESLPFSTRALLHGEVGQFIEKNFPDSIDQNLDLLAFHYERSQRIDKKREYLLKAGSAAQANYANTAALEYYQRVLPLLSPLEQVQVRQKLGQVLTLLGQWQAAEDVLLQAMDLAEDQGDPHALAWCQAGLGDLLSKQGKYADAAGWLELAREGFEKLGDEAGVGQILHSKGTLTAQQGDYKQAQSLYEQSLAIRRKLKDRLRIASLLSNLAILARFRGDTAEARRLSKEGLAIRREVGDKWAIANSLNNMGNVALDQQDYAEARACLEEAVALLREIGDPWAIANSLNNLGNVARAQGDFNAAHRLYRESLQTYREFGDQRALAYLLEDMAALSASQGQAERAITLVAIAAGLRLVVGSPLSSTETARLDALLAPAHQSLDEVAQASAWGRGWKCSLPEAIELALQNDT